MLSKIFLVGALVAFCIPAAFADQYAYVTVQQATAAMKAVGEGNVVQSFCAPCGDKQAHAIKAEKLAIGRIWQGKTANPYEADGESFWELLINGESVDLAYLYVRKDGKWENLAMMLKLDVSDVPRFLDAEKIDKSKG